MRSSVLAVMRYGALSAVAARAEFEATLRGIPGHRFGRFGRRLGLRLLRKGEFHTGSSLILTPVNSVRYWEFDFAERHLPRLAATALDVSSPRLLSLFLAHSGRVQNMTVANPDSADLAETLHIIRSLGIAGIETIRADAVEASHHAGPVDAAWSISVVEHIGGDNHDAEAVRAMYSALAPSGVMILTVPVDRQAWEEFRDHDAYGLAAEESARNFFQRYYDLQTLRARLIDAIGVQPFAVEWFGERRPGTFRRYESEWMKRGIRATVSDPAFIAREFQQFASWEEMPGAGVCGMAFRAPPQ